MWRGRLDYWDIAVLLFEIKKDCYALLHEILVKHYYAENPTVYWHVILNITVKINVIFDYDCNDNPFITG